MAEQLPLVSVCIITYNQERFIKQAIDSVLMQKVKFPWEIIIADDCSKDGTRDIINEYHSRHPHLIKLLFQEKNVGGGKNFVDLINAARGKYVAYLEGDDYWQDPYKLQKQFDFMESHPDFTVCYHKINWKYEYPTHYDAPGRESNTDDPPVSTIYDVLNKGWFIRSCSLFFRNFPLPPGFEKLYVGDFPLHVMLADKGKIGFINEPLGVYRIHNNGQSESFLESKDINKKLKVFRGEINLYEYLNAHTEGRYKKFWKKQLRNLVAGHLRFIYRDQRELFWQELKFLIQKLGMFKLLRILTIKLLTMSINTANTDVKQ